MAESSIRLILSPLILQENRARTFVGEVAVLVNTAECIWFLN